MSSSVPSARSRWWRIARYVLLAVLAAYAALTVATVLTLWRFVDMEAYWQAALRLRDGAPLYPAGYDRIASETFRYAPWYAAAWIPLTFLPKVAVTVGWATVLLLATAYSAWRVARSPGGLIPALALVPLLVVSASFGNAQPLLVAGLIWMPRPWMVGIASSLKITPILFAAGWPVRQVAMSVAVAAVLWAPALLFGLPNYPIAAGTVIALPLWLHLVGAAILALGAWRLSRYRLWLAALAVIVGTPRLSVYDPTYLLVPAANDWSRQAG